ncbi:MAG TPA: alpha-amylase family glycosyl hydrolase [Gaiellaceae bacterium]|nr:alpha-amylase family glycosyl hydrolase [Gaiellaceae bacterium]
MSADWRAVYRLQLSPSFGFRDALAVVPYLRDLGVSHLYLSPSLQAARGSTHGYDVVDPTRISGELGGEAAFRELCSAGLGVLLDVVPNHMATSEEENRFWADPALRRRFFDVDERTGWYRRFFDVGGLGGVRVEDEGVFATTHGKVLELVRDGLVQGLRIDHPDGLADPRGYLERLRTEGVEHVWVEKILEGDEHLREWPVEGTTGYEFANDVTALFVDPAGEEPLTRLYEEVTGERRPFAEVAHEAKLEQARTTFRPELELLRRLHDHPGLEEAVASLHVYRTYVEPWSGRVAQEDREALARVPDDLRRVLLLEDPSVPGEFVTRFQQTTGPVTAKGVEDTALYRWLRLTALNEVGGDPARFSLAVGAFHAANAERAERFPRHLLATTTHDTKRSGDVRARLAALAWMPDEWAALARSRVGAFDDPNEGYLALQTVVGAWPLDEGRLRAYLEKALREGKRTTDWLEPMLGHERRVGDAAVGLLADPAVVALSERLAAAGRRISLGMTLLKLTSPGIPDLYWGDELELLALVDPDNRRPVDWELRRRLLRGAGEPAKLRVVREALALRARRPDVFAGAYEPLDAGDDVCAFRRGRDVTVVVPLRARATKDAAGRGAGHDLLEGLPVGLYERAS